MPKMKSHRGAAKRFKVTGSGLVKHYPSNKSHKNTHKRERRIRALKRNTVLSKSFQKKIREILPH
ncbi:MAG: 50S ribosomal protein L35 [Bacillota bacterium]|uniref:Large ribosomal subunit protein bL35 n=1 Tax=Symbiobacterium thermophilum TaxID=2734 RepID=A0A1Y2T2J4_SYMTR|nr:MAG: 50S ribosomal protein L35 [Symbiobacterium thermophilum]PZN72880.1 MAG: 50S ribosomal protein L35 [Bacillota bacterium]